MSEERGKKVLVTGHKGFIGTVVYNYLKEKGVQTDGFDLGDEFPEERYDYIIHLAARTKIRESGKAPFEYYRDGLDLTMRFLEKARIESSVFVYPTSGSVAEATNPYSLTKKQGIEWVNLYRKMFGVKAHLLKFYNIYGERSGKGAVYFFCEAALGNGEVTIYGDGTHIRDYTNVRDIAHLMYRIVEGEIEEGDHEVGSGIGTSVKELAEKVQKISGKTLRIHYEDYVMPEAERLVASNTVIQNPTTIEEGIKRILDSLS